jgi:predicted RNA-binding Zn-ribbon protein involved in translation (DUF1610 family)
MEDIIVITPGIKPTIYYKHTCTQCNAKLEIKDTLTTFKCPWCTSDEKIVPSIENQIKYYGKQNPSSPREKESNKKSKSKK